MNTQVDASTYEFSRYMRKKRWASIWHQIDEVLQLQPSTILEVGPGPGLFKAVMRHYGVSIETVDIDPELNPDYIASVLDLPFSSASYDCVCCFQMLEHLPYEDSLRAFGELARVARRYIIVSVPDAKKVYAQVLTLPSIGRFVLHIPQPRLRPRTHKFKGEHYWEVNKRDYPLARILDDFLAQMEGGILLRSYRVEENPYHRFMVFAKEQ